MVAAVAVGVSLVAVAYEPEGLGIADVHVVENASAVDVVVATVVSAFDGDEVIFVDYVSDEQQLPLADAAAAVAFVVALCVDGDAFAVGAAVGRQRRANAVDVARKSGDAVGAHDYDGDSAECDSAYVVVAVEVQVAEPFAVAAAVVGGVAADTDL